MHKFFIFTGVHPQSIGLIGTRAEAIGIDVVVGDHSQADFSDGDYCGALVQYSNPYGALESPGRAMSRSLVMHMCTCR